MCIRDRDKIIFLDDGKIEAVGPHDELYTSCPKYRRMVDPVSYTHLDVYKRQVQTHNLDTLHRGEQSLCKVRTDKTSYTRDKNTLVSQIEMCIRDRL